ncbi:TetR/AcrR family transcriptional regulator [Mycolicibacterium phocaicum]|uniref:TetR/AcrR family transcriptional regulator n=1 Tax=Mycolicibacterium phocaicum TaxID=319706 RepID=A0A7I7ZPX9_9MYCO|nr:TetR/AcrR family transcriptional regulator [Mycolicibacterium phocaicum]TLH72299.1 TetR/AcrR family transcriptional regulator [Mycolicibacterium phocaicum]BBZ55293.1 TetR family transcriptional regulator [Mycolicibacterium phocaicum]
MVTVKGDSRERLVAVATELFGEHGYHQTGTEEIVRRSGVTRGSLYHHFADKEALFEEVFDRADQIVSTRVREAAAAAAERGEDAWSVFLAGWDAVLDSAVDAPLQRIRVVDAPAVLGWQKWQERNARYTLANIEAGLVSLLEQGVLAPQPISPLAVLLMGLSNQAVAAIAGASDPVRARRDTGAAVRRLLDGLRDSRRA